MLVFLTVLIIAFVALSLMFMILAIVTKEVSLWISFAACLIALVLAILSMKKRRKEKKAETDEKIRMDTPLMDDVALSQIEQGVLPTLNSVPILLHEGEIAHYDAPATRFITKNKLVGDVGYQTTNSHGFRYKNVTSEYKGEIVLTNMRLVFVQKTAAFECRLSTITSVLHDGNNLVLQSGSSTIKFHVARQELFSSALSLALGNIRKI